MCFCKWIPPFAVCSSCSPAGISPFQSSKLQNCKDCRLQQEIIRCSFVGMIHYCFHWICQIYHTWFSRNARLLISGEACCGITPSGNSWQFAHWRTAVPFQRLLLFLYQRYQVTSTVTSLEDLHRCHSPRKNGYACMIPQNSRSAVWRLSPMIHL